MTARRLRDVVVTLTGTAGLAVLTWLAASWAFSLSLVVLATGSMSPTMPAGSVAVVRAVPAAEIVPGDVVTVPRPGDARLVTHRVVTVSGVAAAPQARALTLRGDANASDDPAQYVVEDVDRVVLAVPGLGWVLEALRRPPVAMLGAVAAAAIVGWGLWPAPTERRGRHSSGAPDGRLPRHARAAVG